MVKVVVVSASRSYWANLVIFMEPTDMGYVLLWLLTCIVVGVLAPSRGRSGFGFFLLSFFLSPLIGLIVLLVVRNLAQERRDALARAEFNEKISEPLRTVAEISSLNIADEIKKLADLRTSGILSEDEFALRKADLLQITGSQLLAKVNTITCARCGSTASYNAINCPKCKGKFVRFPK
jgi:predicted Zn-ribbon and HTH transcriptional regulator